jgi:uncharacterized protein (TIGR00255 family)
MIKSMTAFAQSSGTCDDITVDIIIRSYNSRHLDMKIQMPEFCQVFEDDIKKIIAKTHMRGRVELKISIQDDTRDNELFEVDEERARSYFAALNKIKNDLGLSSEISMADVLSARHVIVASTKEQDSAKLWQAIEPAVEKASKELDSMRKKEGENLYSDFADRLAYIENNLQSVETQAATIPVMYKERLMTRIAKLTSDAQELDPVRLSQEAAILADKSDVSEEIVRLHSHIKQFRDILDAEESEGKKLNFLIQEFNREFNTIGSKAGNASLSHLVVDLKSELEKIREQVQNIE